MSLDRSSLMFSLESVYTWLSVASTRRSVRRNRNPRYAGILLSSSESANLPSLLPSTASRLSRSSASAQNGSSCLPSSTMGPAELTSTRPATEAEVAEAASRALYPPKLLPTRTTGFLMTWSTKLLSWRAHTCPPQHLKPLGTVGLSLNPKPSRSMTNTGLSSASSGALYLQCSNDAPNPCTSNSGVPGLSSPSTDHLTEWPDHSQRRPSRHASPLPEPAFGGLIATAAPPSPPAPHTTTVDAARALRRVTRGDCTAAWSLALVEIKVQQRWVRFNTLVRSGQPLKPMMLMLFGCMLSYLGPQVYALICS
mmetsp:Transcript_21409/g.40879  ORF Transcript_21409/g.40879 Transcript_21409/m.40879 type:complete len:310 (+) Transcript_21409:433-1362(+)